MDFYEYSHVADDMILNHNTVSEISIDCRITSEKNLTNPYKGCANLRLGSKLAKNKGAFLARRHSAFRASIAYRLST